MFEDVWSCSSRFTFLERFPQTLSDCYKHPTSVPMFLTSSAIPILDAVRRRNCMIQLQIPKKNTSYENEVLPQILRISYKDYVTDEEVRAKIQQAIGPHEHLLTIVKRRKLQWYSHVSRSLGLIKTILQGTVKEGRRQGRQRKR